MEKFDVAVIGSGPGGYVAAIRCAQLGMKTALIEKYDTLGGTCLNVGCIPSKTLLDSSEHFYNAAHSFADHGIDINTPKVNLPQMMKRKKEVIDQTCGGIDFLMKKNKIEVLKGWGSFVDATHLKVSKEDKQIDFEASLKKLESIVAQLEDENISLEDSVQSFEVGVNLVKECQKQLQKAELKIKKLLDDGTSTEINK